MNIERVLRDWLRSPAVLYFRHLAYLCAETFINSGKGQGRVAWMPPMDCVTISLHSLLSWAHRSCILSTQQPPRQHLRGPQFYPPLLHTRPGHHELRPLHSYRASTSDPSREWIFSSHLWLAESVSCISSLVCGVP